MKNVLVVIFTLMSFAASAELKLSKVYGIEASDHQELVIGAVNGELNKNPKSYVVELPQGEHELALLCFVHTDEGNFIGPVKNFKIKVEAGKNYQLRVKPKGFGCEVLSSIIEP